MKRAILLTLIAIGLTQSTQAGTSLVWTPLDGNWDFTTKNWFDPLSTPVAFSNGDNVLFDDTGSAVTTVQVGNNVLSPNEVVVDSSYTYTFASASGGKLTNVYSLTKNNSGALILDCDVFATNSVSINEGTVQLGIGAGSASRGNLNVAPINLNGTLAFNRTNTVNFSNNISGSSGKLSIPATATGTWNLYGNNTMTDYSILHNGNMPLYFRTSGSLGSPTNIQVNAAAGVNVRIQMGGGLDFPTSCPITAILAYGANSERFSLMSMAGANTVRGSISLAGGTYADPNSRPQVNLYSQNSGTDLTVYSPVSESDPIANPYVGDFFLRGNGTSGKMYGTINLPNAQFQKVETVTWTLYSTGNKATLTYLSGGRLNMGIADALPVAKLTVVSPAILDLAGFDQRVGPLWGDGLITNSSTASDALLTLTNGGAYSGAIKDNGATKIALKLLNPGAPITQQLLGDCSYSGATTLDIATAIALGNSGLPNSTPIEMGNGSSFDLTNKTDRTFTLGAAQTLKTDGNNYFAGNFVSQGRIEMKINKTGGVVSNDQIRAVGDDQGRPGNITYGGTLALTLTGEALTAADTFKLFSSTNTYSGAFTSISPITPGTDLAWNASTLTVDGTLRVFSTTQPNVSSEVVADGTQLHLSWPTDHTGWILQGQTNTIGGLTTNWYDVAGSPLSNEVYIPIDQANQTVFYRLVYRP
jgi:hypothetical protein